MQVDVLFEQTNPYATRAAQLESDGRSLYLYLGPIDDLPGKTHAVWVQNIIAAPDSTDSASMKNGQAPLIKKTACRHPDGKSLPDKGSIDLVWFAEGSGVSLYLDGQVEAIIPPFSGLNSIQGYAKDCLEYDCGTMPFPESKAFFERVEENLRFWTIRSEKKTWPAYRDKLLHHYESSYGKHTNYYALSRPYPPMAIVEFNHPENHAIDSRIYCTLGMSYQPMPGIENQNADYFTTSHTEIITQGSLDFKDLPGVLGRIAVYPWLAGKGFQDGHHYDSGMEIENNAWLFTKNFDYTNIPGPLKFKTIDDYPVNFLNAVNVTQEDLLVAGSRGVQTVLNNLNKQSIIDGKIAQSDIHDSDFKAR